MSELFTWQSLGTLAGASIAVVLIANTVGKLWPAAPRAWVAVIAAAVISVALWWFTTGQTLQDLVLWLVNAALIFATAMGENQVAVKAKPQRTARAMNGEQAFIEPW